MEDYIQRKQTKKIRVGDIFIGGDSPISVQSMTNTDTRDIKATIDQIKRLEEAGCDIVRLAILDNEAATAIGEIKKHVKIPIVADIHYDYRLAIECMKNGVDKIRLNPGNIGGNDRVRIVAGMAKERGIPIRIGVNSGSVEKGILEKFGGVTAEGMVESALAHVALLENVDFNDIAISIKASSVPMTIAAYRLLSEKCSYPLHVGVTEAGTVYKGTIKSAVGIGCLLAEGIGDTIRVSLTGDPVDEIKAGKQILKSLGILRKGIEIVSCPTCGRTQVNLIDIANSIEPYLEKMDKNIKVAIMGCAVNGPGEAKDADIGIAGGINEVLLFKKGRIVRKIPQENVVEELIKEISQM
ncbi:flavodoxin-dependent (E)-4-hydroxy-3-methylbut-2-enyl-diphosphate synthase [Ruminiclostridium josui]|uniref:flavodoxin-dependent (E)-4-hydroxy-3-methylbut-2-enyl-diphosphate synthase n=1 Tax=Ruminiclostridium josui TaxID=1499 RepID=UPI000467601D|nr:flavodoxin-dependent (E)-4-hydroxy-3-methylbut-2-enyl-diphosphate synthase [Ruminiclostridium josui]